MKQDAKKMENYIGKGINSCHDCESWHE